MYGDIREQVKQRVEFCKGLVKYYREFNIDEVADVVQKDIDKAEEILAKDRANVRELAGVATELARNKYPWQT